MLFSAAPITPDMLAEDPTSVAETDTALAIDSDGSFVAAWAAENEDGDDDEHSGRAERRLHPVDSPLRVSAEQPDRLAAGLEDGRSTADPGLIRGRR